MQWGGRVARARKVDVQSPTPTAHPGGMVVAQGRDDTPLIKLCYVDSLVAPTDAIAAAGAVTGVGCVCWKKLKVSVPNEQRGRSERRRLDPPPELTGGLGDRQQYLWRQ